MLEGYVKVHNSSSDLLVASLSQSLIVGYGSNGKTMGSRKSDTLSVNSCIQMGYCHSTRKYIIGFFLTSINVIGSPGYHDYNRHY